MENKVGDKVPSQKQLDTIYSEIEKGINALGEFCITLQEYERRATNKPIKGAEPLVEKAYQLANDYEISVKHVPLDGMLNDLRLAQEMPRFQSLLARGAQLIADTTLQAKSEMWTAYLSYYNALRRTGEHLPALAAEMKGLQDAMKAARKRPKAASKKHNGKSEGVA